MSRLPELVGQEAAEAQFMTAWEGGRLAHAWLLSGPRGIGKATLARRIAALVLGRPAGQGSLLGAGPGGTGGRVEPDPDHPAVAQVTAGSHPDLRLLTPGVNPKTNKQRDEIVIDDVREAIHFMAMTPAQGGWRVVIVDAADEMNINAANALLKVLEEPPPRALLLLVAHRPARLPATIRSRCRGLTLRPLPEAILEHLLAARAEQPDSGIAAADLRFLVRLGEGSVGRALDLARLGGVDIYRQLVDLLAALPGLDPGQAYAFAEKVTRHPEGLRIAGDLLEGWVARLASTGARGADPAASFPGAPGEAEAARRLLAAAPLDRWVGVWEKISHLLGRARAVHLDPRQCLVNAFLDLDTVARGGRPG
ncbi:DNA polymerase III subunit delta' [Roseospirillum parvum]|uniref:DNA polymerase-3 subunit delta n=1 Tax=Roseospirillum parvum TaxID=83401 RepID=A0A1G7Y7W0_9PROT|nr:DNA polymerase III subunit delta' [Roseospirillum parvum]SDG92542.1 DNA polymerase-3 subunit delta' [Roseospirillum parvum]